MAKKDQDQARKNGKPVSSADKQKSRKHDDRTSGKKAGIIERVQKFFRDLKAELKRVIWPDKEKMIQSTAVVLSIIVASVLVIWAVDGIITSVLTAAGFYDPLNVPTNSTTTAASTSASGESESTETTVSVTEPDDTGDETTASGDSSETSEN